MRGGYIHPKFIRDGKEQCNTMKIRTRASTKSACRDHSDYRPSPNALRKVDDQKSATSPIGDCDDQLSSPQKMPIGMSHPFTSIMHNRQPVNPFFYRQENVASTEMKDVSSSRLDFSDQFTRQQQVEQQNLSSFPVASVPDHSIYSPAWDVEMCDNPMSPTPVGNPPSDQDFTFQTTAISFVDYDRIFHEPLSDDLEPRHLPPENFDNESR